MDTYLTLHSYIQPIKISRLIKINKKQIKSNLHALHCTLDNYNNAKTDEQIHIKKQNNFSKKEI
jgi:hypothetical protein